MSSRSRRLEPSSEVLTSQQVYQITGKIKSVSCKNFVTYAECSFYPTEYLNVIIGPNGTGKSTLVAAIVLALGGEPKLLARSSSIQDYIKNGQTSATILVDIFANDHGKVTTFKRTFNNEGKSEFLVNEEKVSRIKYLSEIAVFKIQINNLCQFLPQDRVQDFAKMNPQEVLLNTITSVCSQDIVDNFVKLKELRKDNLGSKKVLDKDMLKLKESMARRDELNQILLRYNERNEFLSKLNICKAKKRWTEVEKLKSETKEHANDLAAAQMSLEANKRAHENIIKEQEAIAKTAALLTREADSKESSANNLLAAKTQIASKIEEQKKRIREAKAVYERKKRDKAEHDKELQNETKIFQVTIQDLKNAQEELNENSLTQAQSRQYDQQLQHLKSEISKYIKKRTDINTQLDEEYSAEVQMLKRRIDAANNVAEQKLQLLRNNFKDLHTAVLWLRENRDKFEGRIYDPILLELNVPNAEHAKYFENTIRLPDLLSFTCESKADMSLLTNELRIKRKLPVNVAFSPPADECNYSPNEPIDNLKHLGFVGYLIDLVEGPPVILNHLCRLYNLHKIPIGTEAVNRNTDSVPTNIRQYYAGDQRFLVSVSKYSKEPSLMNRHINGKRLLTSRDSNQVEMLQKRLHELLRKTDSLKNERATIERKIDEIEHERSEIVTKKRAADSKFQRLQQLKDRVLRQKAKVEQLKKDSINVEGLENNFMAAVQQSLRKILGLQNQKINHLKAFQQAYAEKLLARIKVVIYKQENQALTDAIHEANENKKRSQHLLDNILRVVETMKRKYKMKMAEAQELTNNYKPSDDNFPFTSQFAELPDEMDELNAAIDDYSARLDIMGAVDQSFVAEHEQRSKEIESLQRAIEGRLHGAQNSESEIRSIFSNWYPQIERLVDTLNEHFSDFMQSMSYVGEIQLDRRDEFDFDSYGIKIMVQYRKNVPLQALDRHVQSGGERAVAIAVYTLSLQHLTHVPFRCVDEINQGMDPKNERKIFEMLVRETTQTGRAQYFFVTPKLLPNLTHNERMSVHIVFNGKMIQSCNAFTFMI